MTKVPFFANFDDMHCYEAVFRMVLKYFIPDQEFSISDLEQMSGKRPHMSTWPHHMLLKLNKLSFHTNMIENFDANAFIKDGGKYLRREYGEEAAAWQIKNSDIAYEQRTYKRYVNELGYEQRIPSIADIDMYLKEGYLIICLVNSRKLNEMPGYIGHALVVYKIDSQKIYFHDPGPPPQQARTVSHSEFEAAWAYPNQSAKSIIAIKKDNHE